MIISIIAAVDEGGGIGIKNKIPWHLPADLKRFKTITMGHHLVMGRKTYQSIGTSLPGRKMIVLSRSPDLILEECSLASSFQTALQLAGDAGEKEVFIVGGAEVYSQALPIADHIYLTRVHCRQEADTYFPNLTNADWIGICSQFHPGDEKNSYPHTFIHYIRSRSE
jgi:dihydrofolate reductase